MLMRSHSPTDFIEPGTSRDIEEPEGPTNGLTAVGGVGGGGGGAGGGVSGGGVSGGRGTVGPGAANPTVP